MNTTKTTLLSVIILLFATTIVMANPQILTYRGGYWFNDHNEEVNTAIINNYETVSYPEPWVINVLEPQLQYRTIESKFSNGETIIIVKGSSTITMTADETITFTVQQ